MELRVIRGNGMTSWSFAAAVTGAETMARIVVIDDVWYVFDGERRTKYRPYEAALHVPAAYLMLSSAELPVLAGEQEIASAQFNRWRGNLAEFREPLSPEQRRRSEQAISEFERMSADESDPSMKRKLAVAKEALAKGTRFEVDPSSGVMVTSQTAKLLVSIEKFEWLENLPPSAFTISQDVEWDDQTKPRSDADLIDCVMVMYDPNFVMEHKTPSLDGYLLNLKTGQLRRLPFKGIGSMPACFLRDRRSVVVSGFNLDATFDLVKLDLETGANTPVVAELSGMALAGELAPDGKSVSAVEVFAGQRVTDLQMTIVNIENGDTKKIGVPGNIGGPCSWLPDGSGFILKRFEQGKGQNGLEPRVLCRLGLDGKLTDLRPGDSPLVLRKSGRILFEDGESRLWHTCALDGTKAELFGDGFKGHGNPAVSPDETKVIFKRYSEGEIPQLILFDIGSTNGKPVTTDGGFLSQPVWR